jgi:hypothetical protein
MKKEFLLNKIYNINTQYSKNTISYVAKAQKCNIICSIWQNFKILHILCFFPKNVLDLNNVDPAPSYVPTQLVTARAPAIMPCYVILILEGLLETGCGTITKLHEFLIFYN